LYFQLFGCIFIKFSEYQSFHDHTLLLFFFIDKLIEVEYIYLERVSERERERERERDNLVTDLLINIFSVMVFI
jgi:hypothetical protein